MGELFGVDSWLLCGALLPIVVPRRAWQFLSAGSSVLAVMGEPPAYVPAPVGCSVQDPVTACGDIVTWLET